MICWMVAEIWAYGIVDQLVVLMHFLFHQKILVWSWQSLQHIFFYFLFHHKFSASSKHIHISLFWNKDIRIRATHRSLWLESSARMSWMRSDWSETSTKVNIDNRHIQKRIIIQNPASMHKLFHYANITQGSPDYPEFISLPRDHLEVS